MTASSSSLPGFWHTMSKADDHAGETMPLGMARPGQIVEVVAIHAGQEAQRRLIDLGLTAGTRVRVVQGDGAGPMLLAFKDDARLAVGRGVALKIMVRTDKR